MAGNADDNAALSTTNGAGRPDRQADGSENGPAAGYRSPLLGLPGAAPPPGDAGSGVDSGVAWHFGDPFGEQRAAARGAAVVDRSHRPVIRIGGSERLSWLHSLTSQHVESLEPGDGAENLVLDLSGRVQEHFVLTDFDDVLWLDTEPSHGITLLDYLTRMVFWADVQPAAADDELAVLSVLGPQSTAADGPLRSVVPLPDAPYASAPLSGGGFVRRMPYPASGSLDLLVPRGELRAWWSRLVDAGAVPAGMWAYEALRVESVRPRLSADTDERTIPHEVGWIGGPEDHGAVHLNKGCYLGQETVARVHNLGRPPRNLVLVHLDGSDEHVPSSGTRIEAGGRGVGRVGTVIQHHELGPVALALVKRSVAEKAAEAGDGGTRTPLTADGCPVAIDPDSVPRDNRVQAGRAAIEKLRGR